MAKLSREEFIQKYNNMFEDENYVFDKDTLNISLMEDITDSISNDESNELERLKSELEQKSIELMELKEKYKQRFLHAVDTEEPLEDKIEELKEEEVIDIKEI